MAYENFDTQNGCNPLLPLNDISNKIYLYKVNVFEKEFDIAKDSENGEVPGKIIDNIKVAKPRLGLTLSYLYPQLNSLFKPLRIINGEKNTNLLGIENVFTTVSNGYTDPSPLESQEEILISNKDLSNGSIQIDGKTVLLSDALTRGASVFIKSNDKMYNLKFNSKNLSQNKKRPQVTLQKRAATQGNKRTSSVDLSDPESIYYNTYLHPEDLDDKEYFDYLGALLFDSRSGMSKYGVPHDNVVQGGWRPDEFLQILDIYKNDPRYERYFHQRDTPSPNIPKYEIGLVTAFEQEWKLKGYSRGSLVNSITLAPQEELTIEVFTYDKFKIEEEKTLTTEFEKNVESSAMAKVSSQIARDLTETTNSNGGLGITLPVEAVAVKADASVSNSITEGINSSLNTINETTLKVSEKFKSTTQIKITQTHEFGEEKRTLRKIKNPNGSRTLTLNYFEVLENYEVDTKVTSNNNFCLLVKNPDYGTINENFILAYEDRLKKCLLSKSYSPAFDAVKILVAQRWFERKSEIKTEIDNTSNQNGGVNTAVPAVPVKPIVRLTLNLRDCLIKFTTLDFIKELDVLNRHYNPFLPDFEKPTRKEVDNAHDVLGRFNFWLKYKVASPGVESKANDFIENLGDAPSEEICIAELETFLTGMDDEWMTTIKMVAINLVIIQLSSLCVIPAPYLIPVLAELALVSSDCGLPAMVEKAKKELKNYEISNLVPPANLAAPAVSTPASFPAQAPPPQVFTLEQLAMANAEFEKFALHVEANKTYYFNQLWKMEDSASRYEILKAKGLIQYIENRILCFVGNKAAYPLKLSAIDPILRNDLETKYSQIKIEADDSKDEEITEYKKIISLPTSGMYVDSVMGACDSLEPYLLERRAIEKEMSQLQNEIAKEKLVQMKIESVRLQNIANNALIDSNNLLSKP